MYISEIKQKIKKEFWALEISAFEIDAVNCPDSKKNSYNPQSKC